MRVHHSNINAFLFTPNRYFEIPDFQRPYSWSESNVKAFLEDLEKSLETKQAHYFGSVVYIIDGKESTIIDGQQRATTVLLMITAIYHHLLESPESSVTPAEQIMENFLINRYGEEKNRIKLRTVTIDDEIFKKIFERKIESSEDKESKLYKAYAFFYEYFSNKNDIDRFVDTLEKFEIVDIELEPSDDDPQRIFESINSTGEPLTDGDKIRNFSLMLGDKDSRDLVFNKYWKRIEKELSGVDTDFITDFFRAYMTAKLGRDIKKYNVYKEFKDLFHREVSSEHIDIPNLSKFYDEVMEYLDFYLFLKFPSRKTLDEYSLLADEAFRINYLKIETMFPYLMTVMSRIRTKELSIGAGKEIFELVENLLARRIICGLTTQGLNKMFATLDKDIENLLTDSPSSNYVDIAKYVFLEKRRSQRFPSDNELYKAIALNPIYGGSSINVNFILSSVEDKTQSKESFLLKRFAEGDKTLSIEHIMPQTLNNQWINDLGPDYLDIHGGNLHTLANLTITGYNSKYSNKSFKEKKEIENGFLSSPLLINDFVRKQEKWGSEELVERRKWWRTQIFSLWPQPITDFVPPTNTDWMSLTSDIKFTSLKIRAVRVLDDESPVTTWRDALDFVVEKLFSDNPTFVEIVTHDDFLSRFIKKNANDLNNPVEILDSGYFVETHMSNSRKSNFLTKLCEALGEDPQAIEFEISKQSKTAED